MAKYIVKQEPLEAIQFPGVTASVERIIALTLFDDWCVEHLKDSPYAGRYVGGIFKLKTKNGGFYSVDIHPGDYMIKTPTGGILIMDADKFESLYQKV